MHAFYRAHQPVQHVYIVAGLVQESTPVKVPAATPGGLVVVTLRTRPKHIDIDHHNAAEATLMNGALEALNRRIQAVLLDHEELDARVPAGANHRHTLIPFGGHRFLCEHMHAGLCTEDRLTGMQATGGGQNHKVGLNLRRRQQGVQRVEC